jgi:hypothetical protein
LGFEEGDEGMCKDCDVWVTVASKFVQYVEMERSIFEKLWKHAQTAESQMSLCLLQQFDFVQRLFEFSQYSIVYEFGRPAHFQPGELLLSMHRRSIFQPYYKDIYDNNMASKFIEEIEKELAQPSKWQIKKSLTTPQSFYEGLMSTVKI